MIDLSLALEFCLNSVKSVGDAETDQKLSVTHLTEDMSRRSLKYF